MARIKLEASGLRSARVKVRSLFSKGKKIQPALKAAVIEVEKWVKRNFTREGGMHEDASLKWKPLKASTVKQRRKGKGKGSAKILRDTGNLQLRWNRRIRNKEASLRSAVGYSKYHEEGTKHIPKRKIFPTERQAIKIIEPIFKGHFK